MGPVEGHFRAAMLRFNPDDAGRLLPTGQGKKSADRGAYEMARHLLRGVFPRCWYSGKEGGRIQEALIPTKGIIAFVFLSKEHGELLVSFGMVRRSSSTATCRGSRCIRKGRGAGKVRCDGRTLGEWQRWFVLIVAAIAVLPSLPIAAMYFAALRVAFLFGHWPHLGNPDASAMPENLQPGSGPLGFLGPLAVYVASAALFAALVLRHSRRSWRVPLALLAGLLTWVVLLLFFPGIPPVSGNGSWIELVAGAVESERIVGRFADREACGIASRAVLSAVDGKRPHIQRLVPIVPCRISERPRLRARAI